MIKPSGKEYVKRVVLRKQNVGDNGRQKFNDPME
jgi:hypothetical protein